TVPYTFRWTYLSNALVPDPETGATPQLGYAGGHYISGTPSINNPPQALPGPHIFETTENPSSTMNDYVIAPQAVFNPVVLSEIVLPNGLSYKFGYNEYGEITKVTYPTGAFEQYKYGKIVPLSSQDAPYDQANRGVTSRWVSPTGTGTDRAQWQYGVTHDAAANKYMQWTKAPDNTYTERYLFKAPPVSQYANQNYPKFGYEDPRNGVPYDERVYEYQGGPMLRRKLTDWTYSSRNVTVNYNGIIRTAPAMRNPRPTKEVSLILDTGTDTALAKTLTYGYDNPSTYEFTTGLNLTVSTESFFDSVNQTTAQTGTINVISPGTGTLASSAVTTYLDNSNYRDRNILGLATSVVLKDANGQPVSKAQTGYDEAALQAYNDFGSDWTDPGVYRGNVTTVRRYIDASAADVPLNQPCPAGVCLDTHAEFDQVGNVWKVKNERGIESQTAYSATYKHAFATSATTAIPDPSGAHGSNAAFTSSSTYDLTTGLVLSTTDANLQTTNFSYKDANDVTDPLNRLRKVTRPDGSWTTYDYNDVAGDLYVETKSSFDATRSTTARQYFDKLGRSVRSFAYETSDANAPWITSDTYYDQLGRVSQVSNPYRTSLPSATPPSSCSLCTTSTYDALGRVKIVTLPDATTIQTDYQGIYTTVTDQAGKQRRQKVDALGRIVRVDEPEASGSLGTVDAPAQATYYDYSTQGNLVHVQQGTGTQLQHRYFKYDSLGRLTYERQVEQAAVFTASDSLTGNSQWSRKIVYDEGDYQGLPTTMTDARNISTQYNYDSLNRIYQVSYSDGTPTVRSYYDQARTGYVNKGRLTTVTTDSIAASGQMPEIPATSQVYDYDLMGRVTRQQQAVGSNSYTLSYGYNLGGQLTSQTYPSGRVVNYSFNDSAGLSSVTSGAKTYASQFDYSSPQGLLKAVTLGNGAVESFDYNDRLQLKTLSLVKDGSTIQQYGYKYGRVNADGTVDESKNNGQIGRIEGFIGTAKQWQQRFSYDSLGRLSQASEYRGDNSQQSYSNTYDYDPFGNRYQKAANQSNPLPYTAVEDTDISKSTNRFTFSQITYDNAGNLTVDNKFRGRQYNYDANGRQKYAALTDGTGAAWSVYDGAGQRVATIANGVMSVMVYDAGGKLVAEYGQAAAGAGGTQYVFSDHQGSTRVVMNSTGIISRQDYQPFGEELSAVGLRSTDPHYAGANSARQKYAGMEKDEATGMAHTLWRKYDGISGRWTSPDPYGGSMTVGDPQSFNRYSYVNNDPVNLTDPLGLMAGANQGYGGFEGWGGTSGLDEPHFGGPSVIQRAMKRHDHKVDNDRYGGDYSDPTPFDDSANDSGDDPSVNATVTIYGDFESVDDMVAALQSLGRGGYYLPDGDGGSPVIMINRFTSHVTKQPLSNPPNVAEPPKAPDRGGPYNTSHTVCVTWFCGGIVNNSNGLMLMSIGVNIGIPKVSYSRVLNEGSQGMGLSGSFSTSWPFTTVPGLTGITVNKPLIPRGPTTVNEFVGTPQLDVTITITGPMPIYTSGAGLAIFPRLFR
ncbi:MAG TPA: RHS repeat-associated core domain-containing protein, partial [Pyrinomonadaceae bacterium]